MHPIPGYPGYHLTDDFKIIGKRGKPLTMCESVHGPHGKLGYLFCCVCAPSTTYGNATLYLHRAIALVHVPGYFDGANVDHIDGNIRNNHPSNLQWVTHQQNVRKGVHCKRAADRYGVDIEVWGTLTRRQKHKHWLMFYKPWLSHLINERY